MTNDFAANGAAHNMPQDAAQLGSAQPTAHGPGRWTGTEPYTFPNITMGTKRRVRVITIGGGASAINLAFQFRTHMTHLEHVAYERNPELGGTWLENRCVGVPRALADHAASAH